MNRSELHRGHSANAADVALSASLAEISGTWSDASKLPSDAVKVPRGAWLKAEIPRLRRASDRGTRQV